MGRNKRGKGGKRKEEKSKEKEKEKYLINFRPIKMVCKKGGG